MEQITRVSRMSDAKKKQLHEAQIKARDAKKHRKAVKLTSDQLLMKYLKQELEKQETPQRIETFDNDDETEPEPTPTTTTQTEETEENETEETEETPVIVEPIKEVKHKKHATKTKARIQPVYQPQPIQQQPVYQPPTGTVQPAYKPPQPRMNNRQLISMLSDVEAKVAGQGASINIFKQ